MYIIPIFNPYYSYRVKESRFIEEALSPFGDNPIITWVQTYYAFTGRLRFARLSRPVSC